MRSPWTMTKFTTALAFAAGSLAALGCPVINQNHCALTALPCGEGMMCSNCASENNGCVSVDTPLGDGCLFDSQTSNPGPTTDTPPTTSSTTLTETTDNTESTPTTVEPTTVGPSTEPTTLTTTTSDTTDTSTTETTEAGPCTGVVIGNPQCGGTEPYCVDGECIGCTNPALDCGDVEENKPACEENSGLCVECQVNADCAGNEDKPACDLNTATCVPCSAHEQCPATACNLETGQCFPKDNVLYVDNTTVEPNECSNDKNDGKSPEFPLCTLQAALLKVAEGVPTTIKVKKGAKAQNLPSEVPEGALTVAIVHYGAVVPSLSVGLGSPVLTVSPGNTVFINRLQIINITPFSDAAISCTGAVLWMDRQLIFNAKTAVRTNNCRFHLRQSIVTGNTFGGLDLNGADPALSRVWIENSFVTENQGSKFGAMKLGGNTNVEILYSTIALNSSPVPQIECLNWTGLLEVRNSAIIHPDPQHYGADCGNRTIVSSWDSFEADEAALKPLFASIDDGVFIARTGGPLEGVAVWQTGDPRLDFDTTPRPTVNCTPDYAGAERPAGLDQVEPVACP